MAPHYHSCVTIGNEYRGNMASAIVFASGKTITYHEHDFLFTTLRRCRDKPTVQCSANNSLRRKFMADVRIKALKNGPHEVAGGVKILDYTGKEYAESQIDPLYLCRCGASKNKPFCDGSHEDIGFKAEETAS
jgi:CDGSH-type Zn-finger protein